MKLNWFDILSNVCWKQNNQMLPIERESAVIKRKLIRISKCFIRWKKRKSIPITNSHHQVYTDAISFYAIVYAIAYFLLQYTAIWCAILSNGILNTTHCRSVHKPISLSQSFEIIIKRSGKVSPTYIYLNYGWIMIIIKALARFQQHKIKFRWVEPWIGRRVRSTDIISYLCIFAFIMLKYYQSESLVNWLICSSVCMANCADQ